MDEDDGARDLHRRETGSRFVSWHVATGHRRRMQAQGVPASHSDFLKVKGIGKAIQGVVKEAPWDTFKPSKAPAPVTLIPAKGLELRCNRLNIFQSDGRKIQEQWESIVGMGLTVPEVAYDMTRSLAMDLETCSVVGSNGRFLVYAIGFR